MKQNFLFNRVLPKLEVVGAILAVAGMGLKWTLQPNGDVLLIVGLSTLAFVYFSGAFASARGTDNVDAGADSQQLLPSSQPNISENHNIFAELVAPAAAGMGAALALVGSLFKLLSWQGSFQFLFGGCVSLTIALLAMAYVGRTNRKYVLVLAFGASIWAIRAETLIEQFHRNDPVLTQLLLYRLHHPRDRAANEAVQQYLRARRQQAQ